MNPIKIFDFLGNEPKSYLFKKNRYQTNLGGCLSILTALIIVFFSFTFISIAFGKQRLTLLSSQTRTFTKSLSLDNIPFLFKPISFKDGLYNPTVMYPVFQLWSYNPESKGAVKITNLPAKRCEVSDLGQYVNLFQDFTDLGSYYCMNKQGVDMTLFGDYGDIAKGYSKIHVFMGKYVNDSKYNSNPGKCLATADVEQMLSALPIHLSITYPDYEIDFRNIENPFVPYIRTEDIIMSYQYMNSHLYYLKKTYVKTDFGFLFEDLDERPQYITEVGQVDMLVGGQWGPRSVWNSCPSLIK
jgi:hypothetical protein